VAFIGVNGTGDGEITTDSLRGIGASWQRLVLLERFDLRPYIDACHASGIKLLWVVARESIGDMSYSQAARFYADRYGDLLDGLQIGNESDHVSPSSWSMSHDDLNNLLFAFNQEFPRTTIIGPGLVSGDPSFVRGMDLSLLDGIAVHPYGQRPGDNDDWSELPGNFGDVNNLLDRYSAEAGGLPLWITEVGVSTTEVSRGFQAVYCQDMLTTLYRRDDVAGAFWFCLGDWMVPEFGIFDAAGNPKPSAAGFTYAAGPMPPLPPEPPEPPTPKPPEPQPMTIPEQSYRAWWTAARPDAEYSHENGFETYWREHMGELGPTLDDHEYSDGGYQWRTFQSGALRWSPSAGVELVLRP
jgi:hypothetical protein